MGAYENPQTVVDTQSGQIWANTIRSVTKSTIDYIDFVGQKNTKLAKEIKKQNQWATDYALNQSEKVQSNITKLKGKGNAAIKASDIVDGLTNTAMSMRQAQTQEEFKKAKVLNSKYQQRLQQLYAVLKADTSSQEFYQKEFDPTIEGLQGGMDLTGPKTLAYVQAQTVNNGLAPGEKEYYYDSENEEWRVKFTGDNFEGTVDEVALSFFNYDPGKIVNINSMIDGAYIGAGWLKDGLPTDAAISEAQYTAAIKGTDKRGLYAKTATGKIAAAMAPTFEAQAESFFQDIPAARGIWGIISKELKDEEINFIEADLVKQGSQMQQDFIKAYTLFAGKRMPSSIYMKKLVDGPKKDDDKDTDSGGKGYGDLNLTPEELYNRFKNDPATSWAQYYDVPNVQYDAQTNIVIIPETEKTQAETFDLSTDQGAAKFFTLVLNKYPGIGGNTIGKRFKNDYLRLIKPEMGPAQEAATKGTGRLDPILQQIQ